jgi:inner membrane protein COX18
MHQPNLKNLSYLCSGAFWFPDLTIPDPTLLLPLLVGLSFAANIFISSNRLVPTATAAKQTRLARAITVLLYGLAAAMVPITAYQPAAVGLYWATSGCLGTAFNLVLLSPRFRRWVGIPPTHMDPERPYQALKVKMLSLLGRTKLETK